MKAVLIDDEPLARSLVAEYLQTYTQVQVVAECNDGFEGIKAIMQHKPDLVFLDVQMPKITGFEMLELLDYRPQVIFTTAFDEYAIKAFDQNAIDYLLKPFSKERFDKAMLKLMNNTSQTDMQKEGEELILTTANNEAEKRVVVKHAGVIKIIPTVDIFYFEAYDDYVKIHTAENIFVKKKTMSYFEQTLQQTQFVRVHRSYIIQVNQLTKIEQLDKDTHAAILKTGVRIPLSKTGYPKLKSVLGL
ncbi:MAG: response regulator [Bacteroidota bacterium]